MRMQRSFFTTVPGATYYYKNRSYYSWKKTTDPNIIDYDLESRDSEQNEAVIFTAIPGATYYYKETNYGEWQKQQTLKKVPAYLKSKNRRPRQKYDVCIYCSARSDILL